jgi:phosphoribosyl 1,2-cyclic phosphodiesterase
MKRAKTHIILFMTVTITVLYTVYIAFHNSAERVNTQIDHAFKSAEYICKANYLVLEANYDEEMLKMGPYPQYLKERIAGPNGHMSNRETADFLAENINESLKYIWLCHLSKDNNHPELAYKTVELSLRNKGVIVGMIVCYEYCPDDIQSDSKFF